LDRAEVVTEEESVTIILMDARSIMKNGTGNTMLAYAETCINSQGSRIPGVVVSLETHILRCCIATALFRLSAGEKTGVLVGEPRDFGTACTIIISAPFYGIAGNIKEAFTRARNRIRKYYLFCFS
jgi:nitrite reductase/ring-hydroxylating ferredoxin subunit